MTEQQLMTHALAAPTVIAIWVGLKSQRKLLPFFATALLALAFLLIKVI